MRFFNKRKTAAVAASAATVTLGLTTDPFWANSVVVTASYCSVTCADWPKTFLVVMTPTLSAEFVALANMGVQVPAADAKLGVEMLEDAAQVKGELRTKLQELAVAELFPLISTQWSQQTAAREARREAAAAVVTAAQAEKEASLKAKYNLC